MLKSDRVGTGLLWEPLVGVPLAMWPAADEAGR